MSKLLKKLIFFIILLPQICLSYDTFEQILRKYDHFFFGKIKKVQNADDKVSVNNMRTKNHQKMVYSKMVLEVYEYFGFEANEIGKKKEIQVHFKGGNLEETNFSEHGIQFVSGQHVLLFVNKKDDQFYLDDFTQGHYNLSYIGHFPYIISDNLRRTKKGGQISFSKFLGLVKKIKYSPMKIIENNRVKPVHVLERSISKLIDVDKKKKGGNGNRLPASTYSENAKGDEGRKIPFFWFVILLGLMGAAYRLIWADHRT